MRSIPSRGYPADPDARAAALAQALVIAADTHPLNNLRVMRQLKAMGVDDDARDEWTRHWIAEGFRCAGGHGRGWAVPRWRRPPYR